MQYLTLISSFNLSVRLRVIYRLEKMSDFELGAPLLEWFAVKLHSIVSYEGVRYLESTYDRLPEEILDCPGRNSH
jgi:hypothetical protein